MTPKRSRAPHAAERGASSERHVALLRAVNVSGTGLVTMATLRETFEALGLRDVRTISQSGNAIFTVDRSLPTIETILERELERRLGLATTILVRDAGAWRDLIRTNPFVDDARSIPSHTLAMPLRERPGDDAVAALSQAIVGPERIALVDRVLYVVYPDGIGESKLTTRAIERYLETRGTARNWNTVRKIDAALSLDA